VVRTFAPSDFSGNFGVSMTIEPGTFSEIEQEAIVLSAVVSMVDDMVNHAIFCPLD
jgi:hypothetical protein